MAKKWIVDFWRDKSSGVLQSVPAEFAFGHQSPVCYDQNACFSRLFRQTTSLGKSTLQSENLKYPCINSLTP